MKGDGAGAGLLQQGAVLGVERIQPAPLAEEPEARGAAGQGDTGKNGEIRGQRESARFWNRYSGGGGSGARCLRRAAGQGGVTEAAGYDGRAGSLSRLAF
jgi:hypothetical protein